LAASRILIVDDDPAHLKLYSWILDRGGFVPVSLLVSGPELKIPPEDSIQLAVVDYRLGNNWTAVKVIEKLRQSYADMPVILLSDFAWLPEDAAPHVSAFVRKGEPQELLDTITKTLRMNSSA
jgi:ActR/RegA family two-component response regulator